MAALTVAERQRIWRGVNRYISNNGITIPVVLKDDLQAAVDAADDWVEANSASFNAALPDAFRNNATPSQKAFLLSVVTLARFSPGLLSNIMGGTD